ncbi:MAG: Protein-glutamate methylesterase/protein-glutamine glutaminase [Legionella sp.]|uniref:protein-glutamate methylesterase/protein-glutamine glutaminase n=1 Tax=Legionella sp. TaxID=459 RepID=UPI003D0BCB80
MKKIRVMIIDDSALMRQIINKLISKDPEIEVIASISNAVYALNMINRLKPDLVTLDIEMPEMDGLTALTELRKTHPTLPVIMCSTLSLKGAEVTIEALERGANDYVTKPTSQSSRQESFESMGTELRCKIHGLMKQYVSPASSLVKKEMPRGLTANPLTGPIDIVAIGISTGGPNALSTLIPKFPADFPVPILIVQHMPALFTRMLAESLDKKSAINVKEAVDGDVLKPGYVWIAPGNFHMTLAKGHFNYIVRLNQEAPENSCRPSVDVLFNSVAQHFKSHALAVVMTGMGQDGLLGCKSIKESGGRVFIQDEESSVVWGMPGAVAKANLEDEIYSLDAIDKAIIKSINQFRVSK